MIKVRIPLTILVDEDEYNAEYGSNDSREDIVDDIDERVLSFVVQGFKPFTFVKDTFFEEDK